MNKLNSAESLRGLACIAVVFSHLLGTFYPQLHNFYKSDLPTFEFAELIYNSPFAFLYSGTGAVFVFFVLSGYVLTLSSLKSSDYLRRFKISIIKRYPRLAIPALFSCVLMYLALQIDIDVSKTAEATQKIKLESTSLIDAIYNGTIGAFLNGDKHYNRALWTMRIELVGSVIIYIACLLQYKPILRHLFLFLIMAILTQIPGTLMLGFYSFIIGHYLYFIKRKAPEGLSVLLMILGLYFCGAHNESQSYSLFFKILDGNTYTLLNFIGGALIVFSVLNSRLIDNFLDKKPLVYLGKISFAIYLIHFTIIYIVCIPVFNFLIENNLSFISSSIISMLITLLAVFLISIVYSKYIDDFSIKFSNNLSKKLVK